jgi:hypothetical protein
MTAIGAASIVARRAILGERLKGRNNQEVQGFIVRTAWQWPFPHQDCR